jgi:hypothetical protein
MTPWETIERFESGGMPPASFHHVDHVELAFSYLCLYPLLEAMQRFTAALKRFATAQGKDKLYHETITWAYILLINERLRRHDDPLTWDEFARTNPDLLSWQDSILNRYYTKATLQSELARKTFLLPDKPVIAEALSKP